jgi:chaperone required for assembly of F1-ATPase
MSAWAPKRFWKAATAEPCDGGFTVRLDGRPVKTPAKTPLVLPTLAMAQAIAAEWDAQEGLLRPETMPATRAANSALDKVAPQHDAVVEEVARYGGSDLLCYRAEGPAELVARQEAGWGPWLDWAAQSLGAPLHVTTGIIHVAQPPESLARLRQEVAQASPFQLAALHDLVAITGSLVLGLAVARGRLTADSAFDLSRIDEHWQAEQWGVDEEAAALDAAKRQALRDAAQFHGLCG